MESSPTLLFSYKLRLLSEGYDTRVRVDFQQNQD